LDIFFVKLFSDLIILLTKVADIDTRVSLDITDFEEGTMSGKKTFWVSYDLGLKGDYTGLYTFFDSVDAKECGDSIAFFQKDYGDDFLESLKKELGQYVTFSKTDRIYVIYLEKKTDKIKGKFLYGGRRRAPWEGFATKSTSVTDEDS
jgi:hypothetical protein